MKITKEMKLYARKLTRYYIKNGTIKRSDKCEICGEISKTEAHHKNYLKVLEVLWLCRKCHLNLHFKRGDLSIGKATATSFKNGYDKRRTASFKKGYDPRRNIIGKNQWSADANSQ